MTVVEMSPVNVGSCVTAFMQVLADGYKGNGSGPSWAAREGGGRSIMLLCGRSISMNP